MIRKEESAREPSEAAFNRLRHSVVEELRETGYIRGSRLRGSHWILVTAMAALLGFVCGVAKPSGQESLRDQLVLHLEAQANGRPRSPVMLASEVEVRPVGDSLQMILDLGIRVEIVESPEAPVVQEILRQSLAASSSPTIRRTAVALLAEFGEEPGVLRAAARNDPDELVRAEALTALADASSPELTELLEERLALDPSLKVRWVAFEALFGAEAAADPLHRARLRLETTEAGLSL